MRALELCTPNSALNRHVLLLLAAAILWSLGGVLIKSIDLTPVTIAGGRSLIAAVVMSLAMPGGSPKNLVADSPRGDRLLGNRLSLCRGNEADHSSQRDLSSIYRADLYRDDQSLVPGRAHQLARLATRPARAFRSGLFSFSTNSVFKVFPG